MYLLTFISHFGIAVGDGEGGRFFPIEMMASCTEAVLLLLHHQKHYGEECGKEIEKFALFCTPSSLPVLVWGSQRGAGWHLGLCGRPQ